MLYLYSWTFLLYNINNYAIRKNYRKYIFYTSQSNQESPASNLTYIEATEQKKSIDFLKIKIIIIENSLIVHHYLFGRSVCFEHREIKCYHSRELSSTRVVHVSRIARSRELLA